MTCHDRLPAQFARGVLVAHGGERLSAVPVMPEDFWAREIQDVAESTAMVRAVLNPILRHARIPRVDARRDGPSTRSMSSGSGPGKDRPRLRVMIPAAVDYVQAITACCKPSPSTSRRVAAAKAVQRGGRGDCSSASRAHAAERYERGAA